MASSKVILAYCIALLLGSICIRCVPSDHEDRRSYIVYLGSIRGEKYSSTLFNHHSILDQVLESNTYPTDVLIRSYTRSFSGFAAKLKDHEIEKLANMKEVVSIFPSITLQLQTTRSWDFMGMTEMVNRNHTAEMDIIIGVIDTGIWSESDSFTDEGFGPVPKSWKGACKGGKNFTCNNKIIGARYYLEESARDDIGHGTHTASTAAGSLVRDASFYGLAKGVARGGVPSARIAAYQVCNSEGCAISDILAAFDDAIADGVDIITISIGYIVHIGFKIDGLAIGAYHAMEKGILTVQSAGNSGPISGSTTSLAPWILSVAASTTDRQIKDKVVLGNGKNLTGDAINSFNLNNTKFPLIHGENASKHCSPGEASLCLEGCLDGELVKGKIVVCEDEAGIKEALKTRAIGVLTPSRVHNVSFVTPLPYTALNIRSFRALRDYMKITKNPTADMQKSEAIKTSAPTVAEFSSRGPNTIVPAIMKPDISAPGVEILAAYSPIASPSEYREDKRSVKYNIVSGTSMSCPHVAAAAAYVKSFHPDWSPSAIKSALMTTAWPMNGTKDMIQEFASGSGHINPIHAVNPGLVYEIVKEDYAKFLCSVGYDTHDLRLVTGDNSTCPGGAEIFSPQDINYPAMVGNVPPTGAFTVKFNRTVRNVGFANSTYRAEIFSSSKMKVTVVPEVLSFKSLNENKSFIVKLVGGGLRNQTTLSTSLVWSDGVHSVRSPITLQVSSG